MKDPTVRTVRIFFRRRLARMSGRNFIDSAIVCSTLHPYSSSRMTAVQQGALPSPVRSFQALLGFQQSAALRAAIGLDLFTAVAEGHTDVAGIARRIGASEKGTRVLCDAMV